MGTKYAEFYADSKSEDKIRKKACPSKNVFIFKFLMQGTQTAFELHWSFKKMREHQLSDSFSLLAEFLRVFLELFFLLVVANNGILSQFLEKGWAFYYHWKS